MKSIISNPVPSMSRIRVFGIGQSAVKFSTTIEPLQANTCTIGVKFSKEGKF